MVSTVDPLPTNPQRVDAPAVFIPTADNWVAALTFWTTQVNALGVEVENLAAASQVSANDSQTSADASEVSNSQSAASASASASSANSKGDWSVLSGPLNIPASVSHKGVIWTLTVNLGAVETSEPGVTTDWIITPSGVLVTAATALFAYNNFG